MTISNSLDTLVPMLAKKAGFTGWSVSYLSDRDTYFISLSDSESDASTYVEVSSCSITSHREFELARIIQNHINSAKKELADTYDK